MSDLETYAFDNLLAGTDPDVVTRVRTVKNGQVLAARQVVAIDESTGHWVAYIKNSSTAGHNVARGIMADAVDASGGATQAVVYMQGCFNQAALVFGTNNVPEDVFNDLRDVGIIIKPIQAG